jgi:GIY-YIG catalytic domain
MLFTLSQKRQLNMQFNDLLNESQIDPSSVIVLRHRPKEPKLRAILPWLATNDHDLFNAYQQTQGPIVEKSMQKAKYVASFIGHRPGKAVFVGLYKNGKPKVLSYAAHWKNKYLLRLNSEYGMVGMQDKARSILWFDLCRTEFRSNWKGRLIVDWPGKELSWYRWANQNKILINAITEDSILVERMPNWSELVLSWDQLGLLPESWKETLSLWRAIYFIVDSDDGKGYIGSAYGADNLLGRWKKYWKSGDGGNNQLKERDPRNFSFSILEILPNGLDKDVVLKIEASWKNRLHTREYGLNDN